MSQVFLLDTSSLHPFSGLVNAVLRRHSTCKTETRATNARRDLPLNITKTTLEFLNRLDGHGAEIRVQPDRRLGLVLPAAHSLDHALLDLAQEKGLQLIPARSRSTRADIGNLQAAQPCFRHMLVQSFESSCKSTKWWPLSHPKSFACWNL